jgi:hypothetical protein
MEPVFMMLGQAAATAACLSIGQNVIPQKLPYPLLRARLLADGQVLATGGPPENSGENNTAAATAVSKNGYTATSAADAGAGKAALAAIAALQARGLIAGADAAYWRRHAAAGQTCDGAKVGALIIAAAVSTGKPVATLDDACDWLKAGGLLQSPAYWRRHAVPGKTCTGGRVASLLGVLAKIQK